MYVNMYVKVYNNVHVSGKIKLLIIFFAKTNMASI